MFPIHEKLQGNDEYLEINCYLVSDKKYKMTLMSTNDDYIYEKEYKTTCIFKILEIIFDIVFKNYRRYCQKLIDSNIIFKLVSKYKGPDRGSRLTSFIFGLQDIYITKLFTMENLVEQVNSFLECGDTFYHILFQQKLHIVKKFFKYNEIDLDLLNVPNKFGITPFFVSLHRNWRENLPEFLLKNNLINEKTFNYQKNKKDGRTCLHMVIIYNVKKLSVLLNYKFMSKELLYKTDNNGNTCLHYLCNKFGSREYKEDLTSYNALNDLLNSKYMKNYSIENQHFVNLENTSGYTCLHFASERLNSIFVDTLLKSQYMTQELFEKKTKYGLTCIIIACKKYRLENIISLLSSTFITREMIDSECYPDFYSYSSYYDNSINYNKHILKVIGDYKWIDLKKITSQNLTLISNNIIKDLHNKLGFQNYEEALNKKEQMQKAVETINNFFFNIYMKPNGIFYNRQLEKLTAF